MDTPSATREGPELVLALAYPVGIDADQVVRELQQALTTVGYDSHVIHLISLLKPDVNTTDVNERYTKLMDAGDKLRADTERPDALALLGAGEVLQERRRRLPHETLDRSFLPRMAYILRSLKRPEEVSSLRAIYGDALHVIAVHSPRGDRVDSLSWLLSKSSVEGLTADSLRSDAEQLIERDERGSGTEFGQRLSETFSLGDVFLDASDLSSMRKSLERFTKALFGYPFATPTRHEYGMFLAYGAALRSADLSRQVGAAILTTDGEVVSLGANEVPKAGGGLYWADDDHDRRDYVIGRDENAVIKRRAVAQLLDRLRQAGVLSESTAVEIDDVLPLLTGTDLMNIGEFGRAVHAEMAALSAAARRGAPVQDCVLFTTTFPCHVCARHIVAAGIKRVVFNEPYPKSLAKYLHADAISVDGGVDERVYFEPYAGVSPALYAELFRMANRGVRRGEGGLAATWDSLNSMPRRSGVPWRYVSQEVNALETVNRLLRNDGEATQGPTTTG